MAKARKRDNIDLCDELTDTVLASVPRADLEALLRACATADVYLTPWDGTAVMSPDRWSRIAASAKRCLQNAKI